MRLWPRSLVGRNALLIVGLIALAEAGSALLVRQLVIKPRVEQIAEAVARNVAAVRAGLAALPASQRTAFVEAFSRRTLMSGAAQEDAAAVALAPHLAPLEEVFVDKVSAALGSDDTDLIWRRESDRNLALRLRVDGIAYWLPLPGVLPARELTGAWLGASLAAAALALLGALAIQRRIERPLRALVAAARALGSGQRPPPLPEDGPAETATLSRAFNQLVAGLDAIERERTFMLAGVSHDLRTPLTKLRLGVEIAAAQIEPAIAASLARSIAEIDAVVGQFLDFARLDGDAVPLEVTSLDTIARDVGALFADHGQAVELQLADGPALPLRAPLVRRAVVNLVENAWRHGRPPVRLTSGGDDGVAWLEVSDAGDGIGGDDLAAMKQPFRRAGGDRSGPAGSGLGLAIVERVARLHGGRLDLGAAEPHGLRARLVVPRTTRP